ncbi:exosortase A [Elioraea sp.]|uniref:exosortase A n=1 Tax=Elioraea sp. TaxID=2185103 RepID=UPI003F706150
MNAIGQTVAPPPAATEATPAPADWRPAALALLAGLAALLAVFWTEAAAAVRVWETSTAYNHCWLIAPIAAWLAWQRRHRLAVLAPRPQPLLALLAIPPALAWLVAERLGIMEGRQLTAWALIQVFVLSVIGWRAAAAMAIPLAYTIFLVPFGGFTVPYLQLITARFIEVGLTLWGISHYSEGLLIETPAGLFHVAEACAGLRFAIAALAFGALYAATMFRSPGRRLIVMALAIIVPIIANGIRALGIVIAAEYLGSAEAAAADHVIYGWGFFSVVLLLLILAGLPFREDRPEKPGEGWWRRLARPASPARPRPAMLAGAAVLGVALAAAGPAAAATLQAEGARAPDEPAPRLALPAGCTTTDCAGFTVSARVLVFPQAATWNEVAGARRRIAQEHDQDLTFTVPIGGGGAWRVRQQGAEGRLVATASWLDGRAVGDGLRSRADQALNSLAGGRGHPVVAAVELRAPEGTVPVQGRTAIQALLEAQAEGLAAQAASLSRR